MINRVLRASFCLAHRQSSDLQKATHSSQHLSSKARRVEFQVLCKHHIPLLVESMDSLPLFKTMLSYNPALTNGGFDFDEFPLIKLLHIGLKLIEDQNADKGIWSKFQKVIRIRLHRCTIEENMRLLYIMLKIWPFYQFRVEFITSICLALKKELILMNDDELRVLFRVTTAGWNQQQRFTGNILIDLHKHIFTRVISRWQERAKSIKNRQLSLDSLYMWINLTLTLSLRNQQGDLNFQRKSIRLTELFTQIYQKATTQGIVPRQPLKDHLLISLNLLSIFEPVIPFFLSSNKESYPKEDAEWGPELVKLKGSILSHGRRSLEREIKQVKSINTLRWILTLMDSQTLQNMLENHGQIQVLQNSQFVKYPRISKLIDLAMSQEASTTEKISFIWDILKYSLITWQTAQLFYHSLPLQDLKELSLSAVLSLLQIQLTIYAYSNCFKPQPHVKNLIIDYFTNNEASLRNFDWLAFHYLRLLYKSDRSNKQDAFGSVQLLQKIREGSIEIKLINKLMREVKQVNASKLIEQQKNMYLNNPNIVSLKKFFIEVRLHEMQILQPIVTYFQRLPHFTNIEKELAVNAYSKSEIQSASVFLQKKLLNDLGWKVINLQLPDFLELTLSQKVESIGQAIKKQEQLMSQERVRAIIE